MSDLGGGISLTTDWDFEVDTTGDIGTTTGISELEKDIAFRTARAVQSSIGKRIDESTEKELQITVQDVLLSDSRIDAIISVNVRQVGMQNKFEIVAEADTAGGPFELVFEVNL